MDIVRLFGKKEPVGGLEISDDFLRLAVLEETKTGRAAIKELAEAPLEKGVVVGGVLKDSAKLRKSLSNLLYEVDSKIDYFIVNILDKNVYSKIFSFPKNVAGEKLEEAMKVATGFNLPFKVDEAYLDWEKADSKTDSNKNEILLSAAPKEIINPYIDALGAANATPIAIETAGLAITRVLGMDSALPNLIVSTGENWTSFIIVREGGVRFLRTLDKVLDGKEITAEIRKISHFYETEDAPIAKVVNIKDLPIAGKFKTHPDVEGKEGLWLPSIGSALRGLLPRSEDNLISLLSTGTEELYEEKKVFVFTKLISDLATGAAVVFGLAFVAVWMLMAQIRMNLDTELKENLLPATENREELEARIDRFNLMTSALAGIHKSSPQWSRLLEEVRAAIVPGVSIFSISVNTPDGLISMSGLAKVRTQTSLFKQSMEKSGLFTDVEIPTPDINFRTDVPFSISFKLKDREFLYKTLNYETNTTAILANLVSCKEGGLRLYPQWYIENLPTTARDQISRIPKGFGSISAISSLRFHLCSTNDYTSLIAPRTHRNLAQTPFVLVS